jgi:hypothetical protein
MRGYYLGAYLGSGDDCGETTPYTLDDGSTVILDCQGRVLVPDAPSAWSFLFSDPVGEVKRATGAVFSGTGEAAGAVVGAATGGFAAGAGKGLASGLFGSLSEQFGGLGGAVVLIAGLAVVAYVLKR